jgi:hypothetical protein
MPTTSCNLQSFFKWKRGMKDISSVGGLSGNGSQGETTGDRAPPSLPSFPLRSRFLIAGVFSFATKALPGKADTLIKKGLKKQVSA